MTEADVENVDAQEEAQALLLGGDGNNDDMQVYAPMTGLVLDDLPVHPYSSRHARNRRVLASSLITLAFAVAVGIMSFGVLFFKRELNAVVGLDPDSGTVIGVLTGALIVAADAWWRGVSTRLTKWENHYTNTQFGNSLLRKRFAFQFVSSKFCLLSSAPASHIATPGMH